MSKLQAVIKPGIPLLLCLLLMMGCKKKEDIREPNGFPEEVGTIVSTSCSVTGCHNAASFEAAAGLNLTSWETLYEGSRGGSAVVPFRPDQSFLFFYTNTDEDAGPVLPPTMPLQADALTDEQQQLIYNWILDGAKSCNGELFFPDEPNRTKYYVANQGCDLIAVFDATTGQIMKYITVGQIDGFVEAPHMIRVSPDGEYWYVLFLANNPYIEKYSTLTDSLVGRAEIGQGDWNTFTISPDGRYAYAVAYAARTVSCANLETLTPAGNIQWGRNLHGSDLNPTGDKLYITEQDGDDIVVFEFDQPLDVQDVKTVDLEQYIPRPISASFAPHEVKLSPDGSMYFVSCQGTNEVRAFQASNDSLLAAIRVGDFPQEFSTSAQRGYLFASCMEDLTTFASDPEKRGSVAIIDMNTLTLIKSVYTGFQPHGLAVDDANGWVLVGNRNSNPTGPAPHHSTDCGGRNGFVTLIDMNTLELVEGFKQEVSVDPYSVAVKP